MLGIAGERCSGCVVVICVVTLVSALLVRVTLMLPMSGFSVRPLSVLFVGSSKVRALGLMNILLVCLL